MKAGKKDNGRALSKQIVREEVAAQLPRSARILEPFAGQGHIYQVVWRHFAGGACMDKDEGKAAAAAQDRPGWAVACGDAERALREGWMGHVAFDAIDLDPYGEPWKYLRALLRSTRLWAARTHLVLTDGYFPQIGITMPCKSLFPDAKPGERQGGIKLDVYREIVRARLVEWCGARFRIVRFDSVMPPKGQTLKGVASHILVLDAAGAPTLTRPSGPG